MTGDELRALVAKVREAKSEFDDVEVKAARGGVPSIGDTISAFANRNGGGTILFGVDEQDDFALCGVGNVQQLQERISNLVQNAIEPPLFPTFTIAPIEGKTVAALAVPELPAHLKPCYWKRDGGKAAYIRVGGTDRRMTDYEVYGYLSARQQADDDRLSVIDASFDDLDHNRITTFLATIAGRRDMDLPYADVLQNRRITALIDGTVRPTLAGLLMFGKYPERFEPELVITFLRYYGTNEDEPTPDGKRFLDNRKFDGPITMMVEDAINHVLASIRQGSRITGLLREDVPEYPVVAIREAILNAVAHRDYSAFVRGSYIQIRLFANRLEIQSPGGLYGNVTEENLTREQSTRNRTLMTLMEDAHIVENRGSGIRAMIAAMHNAKLDPPRFEDVRTSFTVTFFNDSFMEAETARWLQQFAARDLTQTQRRALAHLRHHGTTTLKEYQSLYKPVYAQAYEELRGLIAENLVTIRGSGSSAVYTLNVPTSLPASPSIVTSPRNMLSAEERILAFVRDHGSITNEQCRELLGIQRRRATALLGGLVTAGVLIQTGAGRSTHYVIRALIAH